MIIFTPFLYSKNNMNSKSSTKNIRIAEIRRRSDRENAHMDDETFLNIHPDYQREYEAWNNKLKTRLIESILLGRSTNPIWTVYNDQEDSEEVLDGMHRLTTTLEFFNDKFALSGDFMELDSDQYKAKKFKDLSKEEKQRFRDYEFHFNKLDSSYRNDPQKLRDMYEILNRSSKALNVYEYNKILFLPFYDILSSYVRLVSGTILFQREDSKRGAIESKMIEALALSETELPKTFSSLTKIAQKWLEGFGDDAKEIHLNITERKDQVKETLDEIIYITKRYTESHLFDAAVGTISKNIECLFLITRTVSHFHGDRPLFNRHLSSLVETFRHTFFEKDEAKEEFKENRNSTFQRGMITRIDEILQTEIGNPEPRLFPKKMIQDKLIEQGGCCQKCNRSIVDGDKYEGDHILPWSQKGKTVFENLQVLHQGCHKAK